MTLHLLYGLAWLSFGAGHSVLAGRGAKRRFEQWFGARSRLAYNGVAVVHLVLVLGFGRVLSADAAPFDLPGGVGLVMTGMVVAGAALMAVALAQYDLGRFAGLTAADDGDREALRTDGVHRCVRHPLYSGGLLVVWGLAGDPLGFSTAVWASAYVLVGTWLEERRLVEAYGPAYEAFQRQVPAFVPWRGCRRG